MICGKTFAANSNYGVINGRRNLASFLFQKPPTIGGMRLNTGAHSWKEVLSAVLRIVKVMLIK